MASFRQIMFLGGFLASIFTTVAASNANAVKVNSLTKPQNECLFSVQARAKSDQEPSSLHGLFLAHTSNQEMVLKSRTADLFWFGNNNTITDSLYQELHPFYTLSVDKQQRRLGRAVRMGTYESTRFDLRDFHEVQDGARGSIGDVVPKDPDSAFSYEWMACQTGPSQIEIFLSNASFVEPNCLPVRLVANFVGRCNRPTEPFRATKSSAASSILQRSTAWTAVLTFHIIAISYLF